MTEHSPLDVSGPLPFDAPITSKHLWQSEGVRLGREGIPEGAPFAPGDPVLFPGDASANAAGERHAVPGQHNWIPIGPRNVGGRVTCLAVDPTDSSIMYAGAASGGVFKSVDGGDSWFPLWHGEASLALGGIAVSPSAPQTVWAATGQLRPGGAEVIRGNGVYVSTDAGATWTTSGPPGNAPNLAFSFDAIAAHPTIATTCWAVGPAGVFRTTDGGGSWTPFAAAAGTWYSDVAFSQTTGGASLLFLARAVSTNGEATVVRLDSPDAADAAIETALAAAANQMPVSPAAPALAAAARPGRCKLGVSVSNRNVVYAACARADGGVFGVIRCRNARTSPANTTVWTPIATHPDWTGEGAGHIAMAFGVSPANSNHLAMGFVELYTSVNANTANAANVTWNRAMAWDIYTIDRAHHADHHAIEFVQRGAGPPELWNGNDGGISMSRDWTTGASYLNSTAVGVTSFPLPAGATTWEKRGDGLIAPQMYDLTQSPLVPTVLGCGFQDNGVYITDGGGTWQFVMGADGGFVAFDPDDAYRTYATWQGGIDSVEFPGALVGTLPVAGDSIANSLWPRSLKQGFLDEDGALFVAETVHDPFDSGRVLMGRHQRLYGLRRAAFGDVWAPEPVGPGVELFGAIPAVGAVAQIEVLPSAGARALGFQPARGQGRTATARTPAERARIIAPWQEPFAFGDGDVLRLQVNGTARSITFRDGFAADTANATAAEVVAEIDRQATPDLRAEQCFPARPTEIEIQTIATTPNISITIGGTIFLGSRQNPLGISAGTYTAPPGGRAVVRIPVFEWRVNSMEFPDVTVTPPAGPLTLTVQVTGQPARTVTFNQAADAFAEPASLRVGELVAALRTALADDPVRVEPVFGTKNVRITGTAGNLTFAGAGLAQVNLGPATVPSATAAPWWHANLTTPLQLTVADTAGNGASVRGLPTVFANPTSVVAADLQIVVANAVATGGVAATVTMVGGQVRIAGTAGNLTFGGTALGVLNIAAGAAAAATTAPAGWPIDLTTPLAIQISDAATTATITGNSATFVNPAAVYADEFHSVLSTRLAAAGVAANVDFDRPPLAASTRSAREFAGEPTEIAYSPTVPGRVWVGGAGGLIQASEDNGRTWRTLRWPAIVAQDRRVEAIAFHPTWPNIVYVGLYGERKRFYDNGNFIGSGPADPGLLFRTDDGGVTFTHIGSQVADAGTPPNIVSINALETDPDEPDAVYAATNIGIFVSRNKGQTWATFNEGLPNAWIRDMVFEPTTRMLRAGAWGRGVYERHVGNRPPRDVQVYVRANRLDTGSERPAPDGISPLSSYPATVEPASPDIKVTRSAPARLRDPNGVIDGVDFDAAISHEPVVPGEADLFVQVHNRGAFPATGVRVTVLFADATHGPPPLPELFWIDHAIGELTGDHGQWTVIGDHTLTGAVERVTADLPRVHRFDADFPPDVGSFGAIGLLAIVTSADDTNLATETDVDKLVASSRFVAYRESLVSHPDDDTRLLLRGVNGAQLSVAAAPAPSALQRLGWNVAVPPVAATTGGAEPFDLRPQGGNDRGVLISGPPIPLNLTIRTTRADFAAPPNATRFEMRTVLDREFITAGVPVRTLTFGAGAAPPNRVSLAGRGGTQVAVTGGSLQGVLGLPAGPSAQVDGANSEPFGLAALGAVNTLNLQITPQRDVRFTAEDFANRQVATAREVRAVFNRELQFAGVRVRAEVPRTELRVQGSVTDTLGPEATLGGAHLADLMAGGTSSVAAGGRTALFDLLTVHGTDRITAAVDNFLYLRVTNAGNLDATDSQVRLWAVTVGDPADPDDVEVDLTQFDADPATPGLDAAVTVPAGGSAIAEVPWNPGPAPAGGRWWVLAVANPAGRPIDVPPTFDDFAAFHDFAAGRRGAAYRTFDVAP